MRHCLLIVLGGFALVAITSATYSDDAKQTDAKSFDIRSPSGEVVLAADQILAYEWDSHTLTLKPGVRKSLYEKLKGGLARGAPFVVAVGGAKVYEGAWKSVNSSVSSSTAVIVLDEGVFEPKLLGEDQVRIALGYPSPNFFKGEDLRGDARVKRALQAAGKLKKTETTLSPEGYLKLLKKHAASGAYTPVFDGPAASPVKEQDIQKLIDLLDSMEKCTATIAAGSAVCPEGSTVGHEAAVLIDSFRTGKRYPIANTSTQHRVDRNGLREWWKAETQKPKDR